MRESRTVCQRVEAKLSDFIEGCLPSPDQRLIEKHLAECPTCRQTLSELELTISLLSRLPKPAPRTTPPPSRNLDTESDS